MAVTVLMDGSDVAWRVMEGSVTHTHNGRATATVKMPSDVAVGDFFSSLYIDPGAGERFFGRVKHIDDQGDEDVAYTVFTAVDPGEIVDWRPARDSDGDFSKPSFMVDFPTGPQMLEEILGNSVTFEGDLGFSLGSFGTGGVNLSGLPTDWPMTIGEIAGLLIDTGEVDVVMSYAPGGATMSAYNGRYGSDLSGAVSFKYAMGEDSNCKGCRRTIDGADLMNKFWLYGGPRVGTQLDPAGDQHWKYNVTRDDPGVAALPGFSTVSSLIDSSRSAYLVRMLVTIIDRASEAEGTAAHDLDRVRWLRESLLRAQPKTLVHLTPERGIPPSFGGGDLIHVQAGAKFRGGFSGVQRVYQYSYRWDTDGVVELGEPVGQAGAAAVVVSADQEALS